ncbi:MAG: threonine/serine exporter family protein [Sarcina sp.]
MILKEIIASFLATIGFGIIFNIKGKNLIFAGFGGVLGWIVYKFALFYGISDISSMFLASISFSIYSEICARLLKTPVTTLVICALIPLVPGGGMYYTMYEAIQGNAIEALNKALTTISSAGALALGVIFVSTITRLINSAKKKYYFKNKELNVK